MRGTRPERVSGSKCPLHSAMFTAMGSRIIRFNGYEYVDQFDFPRAVMSHPYECADGRWVYHHGMFETICSADFDSGRQAPSGLRRWRSLFGQTG